MKYKVGQLRRSLLESANEFEPKFGNGLKHGDLNDTFQIKADGKKAAAVSYDNAERMGNQKGRVSLSDEDYYYNEDRNDYERLQRMQSELDIQGADKTFEDRQEAGLFGAYTPVEMERRKKEMDKDGVINGSNARYNNQKWADHQKDAKKKNDERREIAKGYSLSKQDAKVNVGKSEIKEEKLPTLTFKHTRFLTEGHAVSLIPESLKKDGQRFIMRDMNKNTYLFEWAGGAQCLRHENKKQLDEHVSNVKRLFDYKDNLNETRTSGNKQMADEQFSKMMDVMRSFKKK